MLTNSMELLLKLKLKFAIHFNLNIRYNVYFTIYRPKLFFILNFLDCCNKTKYFFLYYKKDTCLKIKYLSKMKYKNVCVLFDFRFRFVNFSDLILTKLPLKPASNEVKKTVIKWI